MLRLATALLLASVTVAQAQRHAPAAGGTPAAQMAGRAKANAGTNRILDAASGGMASLYATPDSASADQPSSAQRIIRGQVNGTPNDPVLHYPYGRYGATLGNVDPNSLANPFVNPGVNPLDRAAPVVPAPQSPFATTGGAPTLQRGR